MIGQTLAMEGMFAFFLESSFLGLLLFGGKRLSERGRWIVTTLLWFGTWLSGYFIVTTNAWMQHPVGYGIDANGRLQLESLGALLLNPWAFWQYVHTMLGAVMTGAFVMAGVGAFYLLGRRHEHDSTDPQRCDPGARPGEQHHPADRFGEDREQGEQPRRTHRAGEITHGAVEAVAAEPPEGLLQAVRQDHDAERHPQGGRREGVARGDEGMSKSC